MRLTTLTVVGVLALSACGANDDQPAVEVVRPDQPVLCPSEDSGVTALDAADGFDARELLGKSLKDAESTAQAAGCTVRVVVEDGEERPQTMDLRRERVNVAVRDGVVVELRGVG